MGLAAHAEPRIASGLRIAHVCRRGVRPGSIIGDPLTEGVPMSNQPAARALGAAAASLLAFGACLYMFLPPTVAETTASVPKTVLFGIAMACSIILHLVFVGIAAQRLQRRAWLWVLIALIGVPVSSIVGPVMLGFFDEERAAAPAPTR